MTEKIESIEILEVDALLRGSCHAKEYGAMCMERDTEGRELSRGPYTSIYALFFQEDRHYVIMKLTSGGTDPRPLAFPIGVMDEAAKPIEIDRRLHRYAKEEAEKYSRNRAIRTLVDKTDFAEQFLPRGRE